MNGFNREFLVFRLVNGSVVEFRDFNAPHKESGDAGSSVRRAVNDINERVGPSDAND